MTVGSAQVAAREVEEETGYRPRSMEHLVTFEPAVGMLRNPNHVYLARGAELIRSGQVLNSGSSARQAQAQAQGSGFLPSPSCIL
jgi:8-oxo-dGTP pyrophosphatase MutT (NUDIX family)